jgi:type IV secretion system protein VirB3
MSRAPRRKAGITSDVLFAGITRPALAFGVPYAALLVNALMTLELFLVTRNLLCVLLYVPLHGLAWLVCLAEPRFFELLAVWGTVRARAGLSSARAWRARTYAISAGAPAARSAPPMLVVEYRSAASCP